MNSASLCSLAGRYDNLIPARFLAPIDFFKFQLWFLNTFGIAVYFLVFTGHTAVTHGILKRRNHFRHFFFVV
jgi:hypothetical protein